MLRGKPGSHKNAFPLLKVVQREKKDKAFNWVVIFTMQFNLGCHKHVGAGLLGNNIIKHQERAKENRRNCFAVFPLSCIDVRLLC